MGKLLRFILILLGKIITPMYVLPPFFFLLAVATFVDATENISYSDIDKWYTKQFTSVVNWFKELWRKA